MSLDFARRPNHCLTTQSKNPVRLIDINVHHPYSTKREKAKTAQVSFQDFIRAKMNRAAGVVKQSQREQYQQYKEYFKSKQVSNLLSYPESGFEEQTTRLGGMTTKDESEEPTLDLSRFKVQVPSSTRDVFSTRRAKSLGAKRTLLDQSDLSPLLKGLEEKDDVYGEDHIGTETDLPERRTSILTETQRYTERELDLSKMSRNDSKRKIVFSDVPKFYANLQTLHKTYVHGQINVIPPENAENNESEVLTEGLKGVGTGTTSQVTENQEVKLAVPIPNTPGESRRLDSEEHNRTAKSSTRGSNLGDGSDRGEHKVELRDKIRSLVYAGSLEQDFQFPIDPEEQSKIYDRLQARMRKFSSPTRKRNRSMDPSAPSVTPSHAGSRMESRSNISAKTLNTEESMRSSPEKKKPKKRHFYGLPNWLGDRQDFGDEFVKYAEGKSKRVIAICAKPPNLRTKDEISTVVEWLQNVEFFASLPVSLFRNLAERVRYRLYAKDEDLCVEGEIGDCLYIIYEGLVACYMNGEEKAKLGKFQAPGQAALHGKRERTATLTAVVATDVLRLELKDYLAIMENFVAREKEEVSNFLRTIKVFNRFNDDQFRRLTDRVQTLKYPKGKVIYKEGDSPDYFYIVRVGMVSVETILAIEKQNVWPVESHLWIKSKLERKVKFKNTLQVKDYFGEAELLKNCRRLNSVVCELDCQLLILKKTDFFACMGTKELNDLSSATKSTTIEDPDTLKAKLLKEEEKKKEMKDVINSSWTAQLRSLNQIELQRRCRKVVEPIKERFEDDFKNFVKQNTYKAMRAYSFANCNYD